MQTLNYENEVAFVAWPGPRGVAHRGPSCYFVNPTTNLADTAFMVHPDWQGCGTGYRHAQACMVQHAMKRGLRGFGPMLPNNTRMLRLARNGPEKVVERTTDSVHLTQWFCSCHRSLVSTKLLPANAALPSTGG